MGEKSEREFTKALKALEQAAPALELTQVLLANLKRTHRNLIQNIQVRERAASRAVAEATKGEERWKRRHDTYAAAYLALQKELDEAHRLIREITSGAEAA